ncbi:hypothetical protein HX030_15805 [Myroides odoratimimus]|uniref:Uncharacterized protein n=1 Tax=Myroides odoratimimus CCUG 10230 TaxID=883150 RepID=A0ABP2NA82_9FLAO|nr:hypothetical protein [Myroides odoratimimus]EHO08538.1 hypothetical protein HMPREF9712_02200 [Myroides odoratimimus CCUG 10230]EPH12406.1 hypothetical protein HMPREF9713_01247 [Myroides odoratimimus CCUG 12700]MDM1411717.1 hypothetical protein [Myroides odoratimimus]MDM1444121.1 hypothetical protein [Myroides odoratimimus]MDM1468478.1 hypothetical protein [Myroides odoratimimus]
MIVFKSDLQNHLSNLNAKKESKNTTNYILSYLTQNTITPIGFYGMLENNQIENILSIKKALINLFIDIKLEILDAIGYLTEDHLQDLNKLKILFQINEQELLSYKTYEIQDIITQQISTLENKCKNNGLDIMKNLKSLKRLLGIPTPELNMTLDTNLYTNSMTEVVI